MDSRSSSEDELEDSRSLVIRVASTALVPFRIASSKTAVKAYLGTFLFIAASLSLIGISSVAYWLFYYNFVPQLSIERIVHLQFGDKFPHGEVNLGSAIASQQPYDVSLELHLPRTPSNVEAGNFMLDLVLLSAPTNTILGANLTSNVVGRSRRAAMLTYASPMVELAHRLYQMPFYLIGWRKEAETIEVSMLESIEFTKGLKNLPQLLQLEIQSKQSLQIYYAKVKFIARLKGLRWLMYRYRMLSFLAFTSVFWSVSMVSASLAWLILSTYIFPLAGTDKQEDDEQIMIKTEREEDEMSDSPRTFPTLGRQPPLKYEAPSALESRSRSGVPIKSEEEEIVAATMIEPLTGEADDEGAEEEGLESERRFDSGLGTSLEEGDREKLQRRRSRAFKAADE